MMRVGAAAALIVLAGTAHAADRPAWCAQLDPLSPVYASVCRVVPPPPAPLPAPTSQRIEFTLACERWMVYRNGAALIVVCLGLPPPAGAAPLTCAGTATQCGR